MYEREQLHARYPYRQPYSRDMPMLQDQHGLYSLQHQLQMKHMKHHYTLPSQQFAANHHRPRFVKEPVIYPPESEPYYSQMPHFMRGGFDRTNGISPSQRNIFSESLLRKRHFEGQIRPQETREQLVPIARATRRPGLLADEIDEKQKKTHTQA